MTKKTTYKGTVTIVLTILFSILSVVAGDKKSKPSILFCSGGIDRSPFLHLTYLQELHKKGFEVDYIESYKQLQNLTPERLSQYNVIVINTTKKSPFRGIDESLDQNFVPMIIDFVKKGGGMLIMAQHPNHIDDSLFEAFGIKIGAGTIKENNPEKIGKLSNYPIKLPLFYTSNIAESPVSKGVNGIWYPAHGRHDCGMTYPLVLDSNWQDVVSTSTSSEAVPMKRDKSSSKIINEISEPIKSPTIFAIRKFGKGRIAIAAMYPQFSIGAGTGFTFNREVLSKGVKGKPSNFENLLDNTYRWLAQTSLKNKAVGGYKTREEVLVSSNKRFQALEKFKKNHTLKKNQYSKNYTPKTFKGIIGAHSSLSDGKGTVSEYAEAAKQAGIDFVVFCESFTNMNEKKYRQLHEECKKYSDKDVAMIPGFSIKNNIGNHTFFIHDGTNWPNGKSKWPDQSFLTGEKKNILELQTTDKNGKFTGYDNKNAFNYFLKHPKGNNSVGYFNWADSGKGMRIPHLRLYSLAAIRYHKNGKLIEDLTDEYLVTIQSTKPPFPISYNEVYSPDELLKEVKSGNALTYVNAGNIAGISTALSWARGSTAYLSDGPVIYWHPCRHGPMTFGAEEFSVRNALLPLGFGASSIAGLKSITIYNGTDLFRHFKLNGEKEFRETLFINAMVAKNLVMIVEDINGKKAISGHRYFKKFDERMVSYCGDHVNSGYMRSFHGPGGLPVCPSPILPVKETGFTWDGGGGFSGTNPLVFFSSSRPVLYTDLGNESGARFNQIPIMETTDEGLVATASNQDELFSEKLVRVTNPWHTFGPTGGPSQLMEYTQRFKEYFPPVTQVENPAWMGVRIGNRPCIFREEFTFKKDFTITQLRLLTEGAGKPEFEYWVVIGRKPDRIEKTIKAGDLKKAEISRLDHGDWFGVFSPDMANSHLFVINRTPITLMVSNKNKHGWLKIMADFGWPAKIREKQVKKGDKYNFELFSLNSSLDVASKTAEDLQKLRSYLHQPENLKLLRGTRTDTAGVVEFKPDNNAIELSLPKPKENLHMTLPIKITGLNRNWTAGLFQKQGYVLGNYGTGENRYRGLGLDLDGSAHFPLYPDLAENTHVLAGHPVAADENGSALKINVVPLSEKPFKWHIDVNNPTDKTITTKLSNAMDLPNLNLPKTKLTIKPGEYKVLN